MNFTLINIYIGEYIIVETPRITDRDNWFMRQKRKNLKRNLELMKNQFLDFFIEVTNPPEPAVRITIAKGIVRFASFSKVLIGSSPEGGPGGGLSLLEL